MRITTKRNAKIHSDQSWCFSFSNAVFTLFTCAVVFGFLIKEASSDSEIEQVPVVDCRNEPDSETEYDPYQRLLNPEVCFKNIVQSIHLGWNQFNELGGKLIDKEGHSGFGWENYDAFDEYYPQGNQKSLYELPQLILFQEVKFSGFCLLNSDKKYPARITQRGKFVSSALQRLIDGDRCKTLIFAKMGHENVKKYFIFLNPPKALGVNPTNLTYEIFDKKDSEDTISVDLHLEIIGTGLLFAEFRKNSFDRVIELSN